MSKNKSKFRQFDDVYDFEHDEHRAQERIKKNINISRKSKINQKNSFLNSLNED